MEDLTVDIGEAEDRVGNAATRGVPGGDVFEDEAAEIGESGLLFVPGWLRMLDLACWTWAKPLSRLTGLAVRPFAWLERRWPAFRRHGYLIAAIVERPTAGEHE